MKQNSTSRRAFTVVELVIVLIVIAVLVAILLPAIGGSNRPNGHGRSAKDGSQLRGIHQGLVMWAENNQGRYPFPSLVDTKDETVALSGAAKDTTANMISLLIFNGFYGPEICVSPAESNTAVKMMTTYAYSAPATAAQPAKALWDPAFSSDFTAGNTSNFSYAHLLPAGRRTTHWANTFNPSDAIIGNRGPLIPSIKHAAGTRTIPSLPSASNTYLIHGARTTWEGWIVYNDNHVNFETNLTPEGITYTDATKHKWDDCPFADEPDDATGINNYLGNFITGGTAPGDFKPIWD